MPSICEQLQIAYQTLKAKKQEFDLSYEKAKTTGNANDTRQARKLMQELKEKRNILEEMTWPFKEYSREKLKNQYETTMASYREFGFFETLSTGQEGIKDEQGREYSVPSLQEITKALRQNKEFYEEKFATLENPRVHITPFALSNRKMTEKYSKLVEEKFVEEKIEGGVRIPDKNKTKLFGIKNKEPLEIEPLELREDKENVYFSNDLDNLLYFPEWEKQGNAVVAKGGITKNEAIEQIGSFRVIILEDIPLAPEQGEGKLIEKEIKIKGKGKKVTRKQVEGGKDASVQYHELKELGEEGLVLEDLISFAILHLKENNIVLDDDRGTSYYCRVLGNNTASGRVPDAYWYRGRRRANLGGNDPRNRNENGVRFGVVV